MQPLPLPTLPPNPIPSLPPLPSPFGMSFCGIPFAVIIFLGVLTTLGWWVFQTAVQHYLATRRMNRAEPRREAFMLSRDTRRAPRQARRSPVNVGSGYDDDDSTARQARRPARSARRPLRWATPQDEEEAAAEVAVEMDEYHAEVDALDEVIIADVTSRNPCA